LQRGEILLEPMLCFLLAEQSFTEVIQVHPHAFVLPCLQMFAEQFGFGREHDVRRLLLHVLFHERDRDARKPSAECLKATEQRAIEWTEKTRHTLHVEDMRKLLRDACRRLGAEGAVGKLYEGSLVARKTQHPVELGLLAPLGSGLQLNGALLQFLRERHCAIDQLRIHR
jgi:hypothetical protein